MTRPAANGDGTGGFILRDDASAVAAWTYAFGGDVLTEDGTAYNYSSPATVEALTFLKGMADEGCAYFFTEGYPNPEFAARRAIFTMGSSSGIPFYNNDVNTVAAENKTEPDAWGVTAIPHTTADPVQNVYGGDVMIAVTTPEQQLAAWIFVKWFTSPEIQAQWDMISGYFPTRAGTEVFLTDYYTANPQWALALCGDGRHLPHASRKEAAAIAHRVGVPWRLLLVTAPNDVWCISNISSSPLPDEGYSGFSGSSGCRSNSKRKQGLQ